MHLHKLPSGTWRVIVQADGVKRTGTAPTKAAAQRRGAEILLEMGRAPTPQTGVTVAELLRVHIDQAELAATTREDYDGLLERLPEWLSSWKVDTVTAPMVGQAYRRLNVDGWTVHRIRRLHTMWRPAFAEAVTWGWIVANPVASVKPPPAPRVELTPPSSIDVGRLIAAATEHSHEFGCALVVLASAGIRRGELCGLRWGDLDLTTGALVVRRAVSATKGAQISVTATKTGARSHRVISLGHDVTRTLRAHHRRQIEQALAAGVRLGDNGWVFTHDFAGPWRPDYVTMMFGRIRSTVGLDSVRLHDLRHYVATELLANGVDPRTVAGRLGHARTSTTLDVYAAFVPANDQEAAEVLERRLSGGKRRPVRLVGRSGSRSTSLRRVR